MNESESSNGWKWATLVLALVLVALLTCLCGGLFGGLLGFSFGKSVSGRAYQVVPDSRVPELPEVPFEWQQPEPWEWEETEELPWLGVFFQMVEEGAEVTGVVEDSPAEDAGLKDGDIIAAVEGKSVTEVHPLDDRILDYEPGDRVELTVLREGDERNITARLGVRPLMQPPMMEEDQFPFMTPPSFGG